ncbi:DUF427 domain-containing protein [Streptosporangium vulgare]|uniref:DUF427 domain-containing protein n=1 Tax=Streptosporangium vulgare TaxID=46190 RepID=A0ABV5TDZ8_9ACTN
MPASGTFNWETGERWVRGIKGDVTVVDSRAPVLVWEASHPVPRYAFPEAEVRSDLLRPAAAPPTGVHEGSTVFYDLVIGGETVANAAWSYPALPGHIAFEWFQHGGEVLEHWYEEEEEIFVHPRDPYKRVDPVPSSRHVRVEIDGRVVADTRRPVLLFETGLPTRYRSHPRRCVFTPEVRRTLTCDRPGSAIHHHDGSVRGTLLRSGTAGRAGTGFVRARKPVETR